MIQCYRYFKHVKVRVILLVFTVVFMSCVKEPQEEAPPETVSTPVQATNPQRINLTESIDLNANTVFLKKEIVRATFQGFIEKIFKNIGDEVKAGDLLILIKTKESTANSNLQITIGGETFKGSVDVRAKSDGIVTALNYSTGDFVSDGEEIAIISNPSSLYITLNVPYQYVSRLNYDAPCLIFLPNSTQLTALIQKVIPSVDPVSQTQTFLLQLNSKESLPENLNVNARIPLKTVKNAIVVPRSTVMSNETLDKFWIMKLIDDSTAVRVNIQKGIETDSLIQVVSPVLNLYDKIISVGAFSLPDTAKVTISR